MKFLSIAGLFGSSLMFGNGFSPVFSVMSETRKQEPSMVSAVYLFFGVKLLVDLFMGVLSMTLWQYPCYYCAWLVAKKSAIGSATVFFLLSNTVSWLQMSNSVFALGGSWCVYSADVYGWFACLAAGVPFFVNSLLATIGFSLLFKLVREVSFSKLPSFGFNY